METANKKLINNVDKRKVFKPHWLKKTRRRGTNSKHNSQLKSWPSCVSENAFSFQYLIKPSFFYFCPFQSKLHTLRDIKINERAKKPKSIEDLAICLVFVEKILFTVPMKKKMPDIGTLMAYKKNRIKINEENYLKGKRQGKKSKANSKREREEKKKKESGIYPFLRQKLMFNVAFAEHFAKPKPNQTFDAKKYH